MPQDDPSARHGLPHAEVERWLQAGSARAKFYAAISEKTRLWSADRRGDRYDQLAVDIRSGDATPAPPSSASPPAVPNGAAPTTPDAQP